MTCNRALWFIAAGGLALLAAPQDHAPVVTGHIRAVTTPEERMRFLDVLGRARTAYRLRNAARGYQLKVSFTVDSGGATAHDGKWEMEDVFDPNQGLRWTAKSSDGYSITRLEVNGMLFGEETGTWVPLRLHEARAALFDPMPTLANMSRSSIRTSDAVLDGTRLSCVLLSIIGEPGVTTSGRHWDETEECVDPQSGVLMTHSQVPGRYYLYDYTDAPRLGDYILPRKVTVTEGGKMVSQISVESLTALDAADPALFVPTEEMKAKGRAITLAGAQKISRALRRGPFARSATNAAVCVFGVVTPDGQLVEAHSLQPADPNSQAAVQAAKRLSYSELPVGPQPQQHFVFVIENFPASQ